VSALLPCFAVLAGLSYERWGRTGRAVLWLILVPSLVLRSLVYAWRSYHVPGIASIWAYYRDRVGSGLSSEPGRRVGLFWAAQAGAAAIGLGSRQERTSRSPEAS
jgi:hypothetical protein